MRNILILLLSVVLMGCVDSSDMETVELRLEYAVCGYIVMSTEHNEEIAIPYSDRTFNQTYEELQMMGFDEGRPIFTLTKVNGQYFK